MVLKKQTTVIFHERKKTASKEERQPKVKKKSLKLNQFHAQTETEKLVILSLLIFFQQPVQVIMVHSKATAQDQPVSWPLKVLQARMCSHS